MAYKIGSTTIVDNDGKMHGIGFGSSPAYKYKTIITKTFTAGGYKDGSPWRNVGKTIHSTDQTSHLGQLLGTAGAYTSGVNNLNIYFHWGCSSSHPGDTTLTQAINMRTDAAYTHQSAFNTTVARNDCGTVFNEHYFAWIFGGGNSAVDRFNLTTETMNSSTLSGGRDGDTMQQGVSAFSSQTNGYVWDDGGQKIIFATEAISSSTNWGNGSQQKGINSKNDFGYCGNEGSYNGGYTLRRWSLTTDSNIGTVAKPHTNCGEENFGMGQDHQYMIGCYDGTGQSNNSWRYNYTTDSGTANPTGVAPAWQSGMSSGHCGWSD